MNEGGLVGTYLFFEILGVQVCPLIFTAVSLYVVGLIGFSAWRAFWSKLTRAQGCADSATCGQCDTYGQFDVVVESEAVPVRYRRCGHERTIHR